MKTNCALIKDLLPLYVDDVVSEETKKIIEQHLEECEECRKEWELLNADVTIPLSENVQKAEAETIKKTKNKLKKKTRKDIIKGALSLAIIAGILTVVMAFVLHNKEERCIHHFLECWLTKSEENLNLYEVCEENSIEIGLGVETDTEEFRKRNEEYQENIKEAFEKVYGDYLTDFALEEYMGEMYMFSYTIHMENEDCRIKQIKVTRDTSDYKFEVELLNEKEQSAVLVSGRIEMKDGKINRIRLTSFGDVTSDSQ